MKKPNRPGGRSNDKSSAAPRPLTNRPATGTPAQPHMPVQNPKGGKPNSAFMISGRERLSLGIHSVKEALKVRPKAVKRLGLREDYLRAPQLKDLADLAMEAEIEIMSLKSAELDHIGTGHQGAAAVINETPTFNIGDVKKLKQCVLIACDGLEDPMNLGSILRSAWLLGAKGVLLPQDRSVSLTTSAAKVASGGAEHVPVEICSNLPRELALLREAGFWIFGLAEKGTGFPWDFKLPEKIVWVIGSESSGLRVTVERACDELVKLPQVPGGSSFNAAVSASMALYESARQHGFSDES